MIEGYRFTGFESAFQPSEATDAAGARCRTPEGSRRWHRGPRQRSGRMRSRFCTCWRISRSACRRSSHGVVGLEAVCVGCGLVVIALAALAFGFASAGGAATRRKDSAGLKAQAGTVAAELRRSRPRRCAIRASQNQRHSDLMKDRSRYDRGVVFFARALTIAIFAGGVFVVVQSLPGMAWENASPSPIQAGLGLIAASLTAAVALAITRDWRGQRADQLAAQDLAVQRTLEAEQREQRANAYARVISGIVQTFTGGSRGDLATDRATIAMWGSSRTVAAVDNWQRVAHSIMKDLGGDVPVERRAELQLLVATVAIEARRDLGLDGALDAHDIAALLFDDYRSQ